MKPNAIVITDKGIGCIEAPEPIEGGFTSDYLEALEAAMKQVVLFKDQYFTANKLAALLSIDKFKQDKLYPVPDGYEIELEYGDGRTFVKNPTYPEAFPRVRAILVPKQDPEHVKDFEKIFPLMPKQEPVKDNGYLSECICTGVCLQLTNAKCKAMVKRPTSIEESAEKAFNLELSKETPQNYNNHLLSTIKHGYLKGFIAGVKSDAAKDYWFETFKQEKK
jgi:hypothetical protein